MDHVIKRALAGLHHDQSVQMEDTKRVRSELRRFRKAHPRLLFTSVHGDQLTITRASREVEDHWVDTGVRPKSVPR